MRANRWLSPSAPGVHHEERRSVGVVLLQERLEARMGGTLAPARQCNSAKRGIHVMLKSQGDVFTTFGRSVPGRPSSGISSASASATFSATS